VQPNAPTFECSAIGAQTPLPLLMLKVQAARLALVAQGCLPGECLLLIDAREYLVQTQEITRTFEKLLSDSEILAKKIAFLPPVGLAKIQTKRLISKNPHKFFEDFSAAEEWLRAA
jgi:hypothetical protein